MSFRIVLIFSIRIGYCYGYIFCIFNTYPEGVYLNSKKKLNRLKKNKKYCQKVTKKGNYQPLYEKYYTRLIKNIKEGTNGRRKD